MFKFLHAADIHLDSPLRGLARYESAPIDAIRDACRKAFTNLVDCAIEKKVAFVLLAGDLYDGDWKDYNTGIFLHHQIGRLDRHDIKVFSITGNHDAASRITRVLETPSNMTTFSSRKVETVQLDTIPVVVHGQSFKSQHVDENLADGFEHGHKGVFNIGLLHTSLEGREGHAMYAPCSPDDLRSKGYQYWALGHVHRYEIVSEDPWIVFPGNVQGRHIRETGEKGCVIVTVDDDLHISSVDFRPCDVLRWQVCRIDLDNVSDMAGVLDRIRSEISDHHSSSNDRPLAIRVTLEGAAAVSDEIAAFPDRFEQQVKAIGAEIAGEDVWIEKVENKTTSRNDGEDEFSYNDKPAFEKLLREFTAVPDDPEAIDGLKDIVAEISQKLPPELAGDETLLNLDDTSVIQGLLREAKHMLVGRLRKTGRE